MTQTPGRADPLTNPMVRVFQNLMRQMMFCLPGAVTSFNPDDQTATVQVGIQKVAGDGRGETHPTIDNVPVNFPGDSHYLWHAVESGCEGLLHFSQRSVDEWLDRGGTVAPADGRMLSLKDAFFVPGFRSRSNKIPGFRNSGAGISDKAGNNYVWMDGQDLKVKAKSMKIDVEDFELTATNSAQIEAMLINLIANMTSIQGMLTNNGVGVGSTHFHTQGNDSDDDAQQPTSTPTT